MNVEENEADRTQLKYLATMIRKSLGAEYIILIVSHIKDGERSLNGCIHYDPEGKFEPELFINSLLSVAADELKERNLKITIENKE